MEDFGLQIGDRDGWLYVLTVSGSIDVGSAPMFRDALFKLVDKRDACVLVDLTNVRFMDSTSLAILLMVARLLADSRIALAVCGGPVILRLLEAAGVSNALNVTRAVRGS